MTLLNQIPALIRVAIVFVLVLIAIRKKLSLGNAFFLGALTLGVLFGGSLSTIAGSVAGSLLDQKTIALALIVTLILVLSDSMETAGQMQRLLGSFRGLVTSPRLNLTVFPALIGLLPMPGGAVFSAPMSKSLVNDPVWAAVNSALSTIGFATSGSTGGRCTPVSF